MNDHIGKGTNSPKVTVIIPNYNHARHLPKRIESVLQQTVSDIDILILDDCSTDESCNIIDSYAKIDKRIRTLYNKKNSGSTFKQWNKGLLQAKGEYIWIAESDDYADIRFLETLLARLDEDSAIGVVYSGSLNVDHEGNVSDDHMIFYHELDPQLWQQDFVQDGLTLVKRFMSFRCIIPNASAVVFRRSIADQVGPANENMRLVGDWLYWAKMLSTTKVAFVSEMLNYFRQHDNNVRSRSAISGLSLVEETIVLQEMKQYGAPDQYFYEKKIESIMSRWFHAMVYFNVPLENHKSIFLNMKKIEKSFPQRFIKEFGFFLFSNKLSGIRQILGDKLMYSIFKK